MQRKENLNYFDILPAELIVEISNFLSSKELKTLYLVNKRCHDILSLHIFPTLYGRSIYFTDWQQHLFKQFKQEADDFKAEHQVGFFNKRNNSWKINSWRFGMIFYLIFGLLIFNPFYLLNKINLAHVTQFLQDTHDLQKVCQPLPNYLFITLSDNCKVLMQHWPHFFKSITILALIIFPLSFYFENKKLQLSSPSLASLQKYNFWLDRNKIPSFQNNMPTSTISELLRVLDYDVEEAKELTQLLNDYLLNKRFDKQKYFTEIDSINLTNLKDVRLMRFASLRLNFWAQERPNMSLLSPSFGR